MLSSRYLAPAGCRTAIRIEAAFLAGSSGSVDDYAVATGYGARGAPALRVASRWGLRRMTALAPIAPRHPGVESPQNRPEGAAQAGDNGADFRAAVGSGQTNGLPPRKRRSSHVPGQHTPGEGCNRHVLHGQMRRHVHADWLHIGQQCAWETQAHPCPTEPGCHRTGIHPHI